MQTTAQLEVLAVSTAIRIRGFKELRLGNFGFNSIFSASNFERHPRPREAVRG